MAVIRISDLCVTLDDKPILQDLTLQIDRGILAILGPNGIGKTSLLRAITGDLKPTSGAVMLDGKLISHMKPRQIAQKISIVPQEHHPVFGYTVEDIVLMGRMPYIKPLSVPGEEDRQITGEVIERLGISHLRKRVYTELSGGERKLVLIAMAVCQQTEIILLDEPTVFLDLYNAHRILDMVRGFAENEQKTIIMVLHDVNQALLCADRALLINDNHTFIEGKIRDVVTSENLSRLYGIDFEPGSTETNKPFIMPIL